MPSDIPARFATTRACTLAAMRDDSKLRQTRAYLLAKRQIEDLLYDVDPLGFGSSVGSPKGEYSDEAARLIPLLTSVLAGEPARQLDAILPPPVDVRLIEQLVDLVRPLAAQNADARGTGVLRAH